MKRFLPLGIFLVLAVFLAVGLGLNPREVPSPLIDKPAASFTLPQLHDSAHTFSPQDMRGKVWILNVWASWCVACLEEHPLMVDLSKSDVVPIIGLNYKDGRQEALGWLDKHGNPYTLSAQDLNGAVGIDYGVYGVPETYVVDKDGVIRLKIIGSIAVDKNGKILDLPKEIEKTNLKKLVLPCVKLLQDAAGPKKCES